MLSIAPDLDNKFKDVEPILYFRSLLNNERWWQESKYEEGANITLMDGGAIRVPGKHECWHALIENYARDVARGAELFVSQKVEKYYRLFFELDGDDQSGETWSAADIKAIVCIAQEAVHKFVRPMQADEQQREPLHLVCVSIKFHNGLPTWAPRLHLVWPNVIVHSRLAMFIWEYLCLLLDKKLPRRDQPNLSAGKREWKQVIDASAMENANKVNMRMNFSYKAENCNECTRRAQTSNSSARGASKLVMANRCTNTNCNGRGKYAQTGRYELRWIMDNAGRVIPAVTQKYVLNYKDPELFADRFDSRDVDVKRIHARQAVIARQIGITQIHTLCSTVSSWLTIPGSVPSPLPLKVVNIQGVGNTWLTAQELAAQGTANKVTTVHGYEKDLQEQHARYPSWKEAEIVPVDSDICAGLTQYFRHECLEEWRNIDITKIKRCRTSQTREVFYLITVAGEGSNICLNKRPDKEGRRAHTSNRIYFRVTVKGLQQMCWSTASRQGMRMVGSSCKDYASNARVLPLPLQRLMFSEPKTKVPENSWIEKQRIKRALEKRASDSAAAAAAAATVKLVGNSNNTNPLERKAEEEMLTSSNAMVQTNYYHKVAKSRQGGAMVVGEIMFTTPEDPTIKLYVKGGVPCEAPTRCSKKIESNGELCMRPKQMSDWERSMISTSNSSYPQTGPLTAATKSKTTTTSKKKIQDEYR